jgi:4-hydroxy-tetrahydrodipicolinate synthase
MKPGAYTALITPMKDDGLDLEGLRQLVRRQVEAGIDGIIVLGSTGEASTMTPEERREVVRSAVEAAAGDCEIIVGTGSNSTVQTIALTREAKELKADGALVVTPYYNKPSQEGIYRHFEAVSQAVDLPMMVYNVASRTGRNIETVTLRRIAQLNTVVGVKESSGDVTQISEVVAIGRERPFLVWSGDDYMTWPLMAMGGHGVVSVVSNLAPKAIVDMVQAAAQGRMGEAQRLHHRLWPLFRDAFLDTNPVCIKTMMASVGLPAGNCRLPLCECAPALRERLHQTATQFAS